MAGVLTIPPPLRAGGDEDPAAGSVQLSLVAGFELRCGGAPVSLPMGAKRLLAFLALHERPLPRSHVAESLWPDVPDRRAWANLRSALWRLGPLRERVIEQAGDQLALAAAVDVDARRASRIASGLVAGVVVDAAVADQRIFEGELLPGWSEEWLSTERERHRQQGLLALELLCERLSAQGRYRSAISAGLAAAVCDPLRESAHQAVIAAHLAAGNVTEAVRQFERFERLVKRELGLEPSDGLKRLVSALW
ncbi:MAG TPA: BTAD domain-containing putative transcriptional regulator [Candidatus Dormibacteraeota bacterium]|nr:BTAD domain-containing putative transcriptional regulator [Candidatus Dormibacteraeota bacterium]